MREVFQIQPRPELCGYVTAIPEETAERVASHVAPLGPYVVLHYQGNTAQQIKNPPEFAIRKMVRQIVELGRNVVLIDFDRKSGLRDEPGVVVFPREHALWPHGDGDLATLAALAKQADLAIGVDSGPGKAFAAGGGRCLILWPGLHPLHYHGLDQCVHVLKSNHLRLIHEPRSSGSNYFYRHYAHVAVKRNFDAELPGIVERALLDWEEFHRAAHPEIVMAGNWHVRSHNATGDTDIIRNVYEQDEYKLSEIKDLPDGAVVVDIGAHIGAFARKAHERWPNAKIVCVEPVTESAKLLQLNVGHFATVIHAACTYEPQAVLWKSFAPGVECSTGGSTVLPPGEKPRQVGYHYTQEEMPPTVTLEEVLEIAGVDRVDLLKLDCEESEFSILENTTSLLATQTILGEFHGQDRWEALVADRFDRWEHKLLFESPARFCGLFQLHRKPPVKRKGARADLPWIAVPEGIGDAVWSLMKVPAILRERGCEQCVIGVHGGIVNSAAATRALPFVERFDFVAEVRYEPSALATGGVEPCGAYRYHTSRADWREYDWMLSANGHLEHGKRLETWLPHWPTDWEIARRWRFEPEEIGGAKALRDVLGPFVCFYLGPKAGNTRSGNNRGELWRPEDWGKLAELFRGAGQRIVLIGAEYDRSYVERCRPYLGEFTDRVGKWGIGQTYAAIREASATMAYQSGLAIFGVYLGANVASWWRPYGDSIAPERFVSFHEDMAHGWAPPGVVESGQYLPQIYGRSTPEGIFEHAEKHWLK